MKATIVVGLIVLAGFNGQAAAQTFPGFGGGQQAREPARSDVPRPLPSPESVVLGGVPANQLVPGVLDLTLSDAIARALEHNLAAVTGETAIASARGTRLRTLSDLLPDVTSRLSETRETINLAAFGFRVPGAPEIVGPFNLFNVRLFLSQSLVDVNALMSARADAKRLSAAEYSYKSARDLVVLVAADLYLRVLASGSRVEAFRTQLQTAEALATQASDLKNAGLIAGIDVLRARVQVQAQQQRVSAAQNEFEKQKLTLARAVGLAIGQEFRLSDEVPYAPLPALHLEDAVARAQESRPDYLAAQALVAAAEDARKAVTGAALPSLEVDADYGGIGSSISDARGTFSVAAIVRVPVFQGGRLRGRLLEADAQLRQRRAELEDLRARIYYEVRTAFLDLKAGEEQVEVARSTIELANQQVAQARDRFAAGVAGNIEVVQAQEAVATANESYIAAIYGHNVAKGVLARALGIAEQSLRQFLGGGR